MEKTCSQKSHGIVPLKSEKSEIKKILDEKFERGGGKEGGVKNNRSKRGQGDKEKSRKCKTGG
jgi:hypothetical protein